jgi:hypothetical protein
MGDEEHDNEFCGSRDSLLEGLFIRLKGWHDTLGFISGYIDFLLSSLQVQDYRVEHLGKKLQWTLHYTSKPSRASFTYPI